MAPTNERIAKVVSEIIEVPAQEVAAAAQFTDLSRWDSLAHLNVVLGIEQEFGVQFDIEELTQITGVDAVAALLARKLQ
jgi:acyl carrier protein